MSRKVLGGILIVVGLGSIALGVARGGRHHHERRARFEEHVAELCVNAARHADDDPRRFDHDGRRDRHDRWERRWREHHGDAPPPPPPVAPGAPVAPAPEQAQ